MAVAGWAVSPSLALDIIISCCVFAEWLSQELKLNYFHSLGSDAKVTTTTMDRSGNLRTTTFGMDLFIPITFRSNRPLI